MGFGRIARGHRFVYHARTDVAGMGGACGSRGGGHVELGVQLRHAVSRVILVPSHPRLEVHWP